LYPALSAAWARRDFSQVERAFLGTFRVLAAVGFVFSAGLSALSPKLIPLIYGDKYLGAIIPFEILPWVILAIFMDFPIGSLLNATHRAKLKTYAMLATTAVSVAANLVLVPRYAAVGAAWAGVISFWFLFGFGLFYVRRDAGSVGKKLGILAKALGAAAVSWLAWRWSMDQMPLFAACTFGGIVALAAAFGTGLLTRRDLTFVLNLRKPSITPITHVES
jgi:O-antigen/teichoic acid export membrane protein